MPGGRCGHPTLVTPLPLVVGPLRRLARTLQEQSVQEVTRTIGSGRGRIEKLIRALEEERNGVLNLGLGAESRGDLQVRCFELSICKCSRLSI